MVVRGDTLHDEEMAPEIVGLDAAGRSRKTVRAIQGVTFAFAVQPAESTIAKIGM